MKRTIWLSAILYVWLYLLCGMAVASPDFYWTRQSVSALYDWANDVACDGAGNVYVTGNYKGHMDFGSTNLPATGSSAPEVYLAKYDSAGSNIWVRRGIGNYGEDSTAVSVDPAGNVFITGILRGTMTLGTFNLVSAGADDMFMAKFDADGNVLWARRAGGSGYDQGNGIAADTAGNVYVTGWFSGSADFDGIGLSSSGPNDGFIAKYSGSGSLLWVRAVGGSLSGLANEVALGLDGGPLITGNFSGTATIGSTSLTSRGGTDVFVAKWNSSGDPLWAVSGGSTNADIGNGIAVDGTGNACVIGKVGGAALFGSENTSSSGVFLAKYDTNGDLSWVAHAGASSTMGADIACDSNNEIYATGYFDGTVTFQTTNLVSKGNIDAFVVKYGTTGSMLWVQSAGGAGLDRGYGVAVDHEGRAIVVGQFVGQASFGAQPVTSIGGGDIFVAKYEPAGELAWLRQAGGGAKHYGLAVAANAESIFMAGAYHCSVMFGTAQLASSGYYNAFLAKYDAGGGAIWARSAGGLGNTLAYAVAADAQGNSYMAGKFAFTSTFGSIPMTSAGDYDVFITKYTPAGSASWAVRAGGSLVDGAEALALDPDGNLVVLGHYRGSASFGSSTLSALGEDDVFVAKLDANGNFLWARSCGGTGADSAGGLGVDAAGNVYIAGVFRANASFGSIQLTSTGQGEIFTAKYDGSGNCLWACSYGGMGEDSGDALTTDAAGNTYIAGVFSGTATFGASNLVSQSAQDLYCAKVDAAGELLWVRAFGQQAGSSYFLRSLCLDSSDQPMLAGSFRGTATFGSTNLVAAAGTMNGFVAGLTAAGDIAFVLQAQGTDQVAPQALADDGAGSTYLTGTFDETATFGGRTMVSSGYADIFLSKLTTPVTPVITTHPVGGTNFIGANFGFTCSAFGTEDLRYQWLHEGAPIPSATNATLALSNLQPSDAGCYSVVISNSHGSAESSNACLSVSTEQLPIVGPPPCLWAISVGSTNFDSVRMIATDASGNAYVSGEFSYITDFGGVVLTNADGRDSFIAKYNPTGNLLWVRQGAGSGDAAAQMSVDSQGNGLVLASFTGTYTLGDVTFVSAGDNDVCVAKYNPSGTLLWARQIGNADADIAYGICADEQDNAYVVGQFKNTLTIGASNFTANTGWWNTYLVKYDADGAVVWAKHARGVGTGHPTTWVRGVVTDADGNIYWGFSIDGTVVVDGVEYTEDLWTSSVPLIMKFTPSGTLLWVKRFEPTLFANIYGSLATDAEGNLLCAGTFGGTNYIDSIPLTAERGASALYTAKFNGAGTLQWVRQCNETNRQTSVMDVDTDTSGNVFLAGRFRDNVSFGETNLTRSGQHVYVAKYNSAGLLRWAFSLGGTNLEECGGMSAGSNDIISLTGFYYGTVDVGGVILTNRGDWGDIFITRYGPAQAQIELGNLTQQYDGQPKPVSFETSPTGLAVIVTYNGALDPPTAAGAYNVYAVVSNPDYSGATSSTLFVSCGLPVINTRPVLSITTTNALGYGELLSDGSDPQTSCGFCWSMASNPTVADAIAWCGSMQGSIAVAPITELQPANRYYLRAWATNAAGLAYGENVTFGTACLIVSSAGVHGTVSPEGAVEVPYGGSQEFLIAADPWYNVAQILLDDMMIGVANSIHFDNTASNHALNVLFGEKLAAMGTPEWWLADHGFTSDFDAAATNDDEPDGFFTWQEYIADTDPKDSNSYPRVDLVVTEGSDPVVTWPASAGRVYQIHRCDDLVIGQWDTQQLSLGAGQWTDTNPPPTTNRYYRIAPQLP